MCPFIYFILVACSSLLPVILNFSIVILNFPIVTQNQLYFLYLSFHLGSDLHSAEILINVDLKEPSWWVWVTDDMVPSTVEERSGLDDESYVIVSEEHVVDGVATFIARCILSNPKAQVYISTIKYILEGSLFMGCV